MTSHQLYFEFQYGLVQKSRNILFVYCHSLTDGDFLKENSSFGRGSVRNLLVHIANTYEFWIVKHALQKRIEFTDYGSISSLTDVEHLFNSIDVEVLDFIHKYEQSKFDPIALKVNGSTRHLTAFELFTHVITHEFHHKGQILSLSRHLGYTPVDTDIIR